MLAVLVHAVEVLGCLGARNNLRGHVLILAHPVAQLHGNRCQTCPQRGPFGLVEMLEPRLGSQTGHQQPGAEHTAMSLLHDSSLGARRGPMLSEIPAPDQPPGPLRTARPARGWGADGGSSMLA